MLSSPLWRSSPRSGPGAAPGRLVLRTASAKVTGHPATALGCVAARWSGSCCARFERRVAWVRQDSRPKALPCLGVQVVPWQARRPRVSGLSVSHAALVVLEHNSDRSPQYLCRARPWIRLARRTVSCSCAASGGVTAERRQPDLAQLEARSHPSRWPIAG